MENMIDFVNSFRPRISSRDDIAGFLENLHKEEKEKEGVSNINKGYFNITAITTPADYYAESILGKEKSQELKKILNQGNKIHRIVQNWFREHEDYFGSETILDGYKKGILARGKPDGSINNSIVEIKSIKKLPETPEQIIEKHPQYLEQLAFYSILDFNSPSENYFVFVEMNSPYRIKTFKLSILDFDKIKNVLKKRIHLLREVLDNNENPKILGKCRYCYNKDSCNVYNEGRCPFSNEESLKCEVKEFIELNESPEFTKNLEDLRKKYGNSYKFFNAFNLLHPRKYCLKKITGKEENFERKNEKEKSYFSNLVFEFIKNNSLFPKNIEESNFKEFGLGNYSWFVDKNSITPEGKVIPFITHISYSSDFDKPVRYKIAELGVYLMAHGKSRGMIFQYYPIKDKIKVFDISYNFEGDYMNELKRIIEGLKNPENFRNLPKCSFGCDECEYKEECLKEE